MEEPTWTQKLKIKMKRAFYFKLDLQNRLYKGHVYQKKAVKCQKDMMKKVQIPMSPTGLEEAITPKHEWISKHGY